MRLSSSPISVAVSLLIGTPIGYIGGSAIVLIPWAIIGLVIGYVSANKKAAILNGAGYGFTVSYVFMVAAYNGQDPIRTKIVPFLIFGLFGAFCGIILGLIAFMVRRSIGKRIT